MGGWRGLVVRREIPVEEDSANVLGHVHDEIEPITYSVLVLVVWSIWIVA